MAAPVISVENLSKSYLVGHRAERPVGMHNYTALRDVLVRELRNAARKAVDVVRGRQVVQGDAVEEFWALKDVSFEVQEGEVLGIIGKNGAGKSTLLKILSRITEPTRGRVTLRGRVASLLEVGTGFHPELTGRENIFLNGAILGMSRGEIRRKFDEIVAFAEVARFLDTPVKRYSSGMYVRLAFAVAAHLEPEILVVDEVLAVGDAEFQKKCLGKIDEVSRREGRTVLFVSHNMAAISGLAHRALLLNDGRVALDAGVEEAVSAYLGGKLYEPIYLGLPKEKAARAHIARAEVRTSEGAGVHYADRPLEVAAWIAHPEGRLRGCLGIQIMNGFNMSATNLYAYPPECTFGREPGTTLVRFHVLKPRLHAGQFHLRIWLTEPEGELHEMVDNVCRFEVVREMSGIAKNWPSNACVYHEEFSAELTKISDHQTMRTLESAGDQAGTA